MGCFELFVGFPHYREARDISRMEPSIEVVQVWWPHCGDVGFSQLLLLLHLGGRRHSPVPAKGQGQGKTPQF